MYLFICVELYYAMRFTFFVCTLFCWNPSDWLLFCHVLLLCFLRAPTTTSRRRAFARNLDFSSQVVRKPLPFACLWMHHLFWQCYFGLFNPSLHFIWNLHFLPFSLHFILTEYGLQSIVRSLQSIVRSLQLVRIRGVFEKALALPIKIFPRQWQRLTFFVVVKLWIK